MLRHMLTSWWPRKSRKTEHSSCFDAAEFGVQPDQISRAAREVVHELQQHGYEAYVVGGSIRDLLLGGKPKDFDVATSARPEQVKKVFRRCRLIGRRFRLAHVFIRGEMIEVATFRRAAKSWSRRFKKNASGLVLSDNQFGRMDEDAWRRDFSINALYYDPSRNLIIDHVHGLEDIEKKRVRILGDVKTRLREDPVRILRAIRVQAQFNLSLESQLEAHIQQEAHALKEVSSSRLYEELLKTLYRGCAKKQLEALATHQVLGYVIPELARQWQEHGCFADIVEHGLANTDKRIMQGLSINPAFLLSVMLWHPVQTYFRSFMSRKPARVAMTRAMDQAIDEQNLATAVPKRIVSMMLEIWRMQYPLEHHRARSALLLSSQKRFRAAYDFLLLRVDEAPDLKHIADWWTTFQEVDRDEQEAMMAALPQPKKRKSRRKRR